MRWRVERPRYDYVEVPVDPAALRRADTFGRYFRAVWVGLFLAFIVVACMFLVVTFAEDVGNWVIDLGLWVSELE